MSLASDTIAALATPPGRGGIAIVRVSGSAVKKIIRDLFARDLPPRQANYLPFIDAQGELLDEGLAIFFPHPHSFTGEDVLELQGHGSPIVVDLLLQRILGLGARLARPGEFSERAFLNDKMDLAQAEAIADLINASSAQAARSALRSLQGEFSREINELIEALIQIRIYIEAAIDFTDEEIDFLSDATLIAKLHVVLQSLVEIQAKAKQGNFLREGISIVIAGAPNAGKSSLLNYLSRQEIAIVTDIPGTTRDVLRHPILIDGMPVHVIDTAGLRASDDAVEQEGIRRAYREMENADLILFVADANTMTNEKYHHNTIPIIYVRNKIDLLTEAAGVNSKEGETIVSLSAKSGEGIDLLLAQIKAKVGFHSEADGIFLARRRHLDALSRAHIHVMASLTQLTEYRAGELAAEELRLAQLALSEITGEFSSDDLLGRIFSSFCIGK